MKTLIYGFAMSMCLSTATVWAADAQVPAQQASYDFGDYTSQTLTQKAWNALDTNDYRGVELYATKCVEMYEGKAREQQAALTDFAPKDQVFANWALNDVATSYFVLGRALRAQGKLQEAETVFKKVRTDFSYAQAWDPHGWFWKLAAGADDQLRLIAAGMPR